MKKLLILLSFSLLSALNISASVPVGLGDEYITPLTYPKFSVIADYVMNRHFLGFADSRLRHKIPHNVFGGGLSFEAGLYRYFNAGAIISLDANHVTAGEPLFMRFSLFAKPYFPIGERLSIFGRFGIGIAWSLLGSGSMQSYLGNTKQKIGRDLERVYNHQSYRSGHYGGSGSGTIGLEFYPWSRFGIALEWGIRASLFTTSKNVPLIEKVAEVPGAPSTFSFMIYEMPLSLTLNMIF